MKLTTNDMQGLIVRGYKYLTAASYILLKITDVAAATKYFNFLADHITTGEKPTTNDSRVDKEPENAVNIAFTSSGIARLLNEDILNTFSREFIEGMSFRQGAYNKRDENTMMSGDEENLAAAFESAEPEERPTMLGDRGRNHPSNWHWGNEQNPVDVLLMVYAKNKKALEELITHIFCNHQQGVAVVYTAGTYEYNPDNPREHFGFMDGISQPIIKGLRKSNEAVDKRTLINPGEFILGYQNEYNSFSPSPYVEKNKASDDLQPHPVDAGKNDLGRNGTYLVFRQIEQHVEAFWEYLYTHSKETAASKTEQAVKLGAKMVGRWPDGRPLVQAPSLGCPMTDPTLNDFTYSDTDKHGVMCPLGAHIRRTNPRDHVHAGRSPKDSLELSKKHRMLRRGRIYGEPLDKDFNIDNIIHHHINGKQPANNTATTPVTTATGKENENSVRGIHFICLVSDISRQFEFVQNVWANTSTFAGLCNEVDPIISPRPTSEQPDCHEFTTPQHIVRNRYKNIPEFTTVVGGAYFFMPGISALKYIVKYSMANEAG
jgi:Dyp-type peroxidase family